MGGRAMRADGLSGAFIGHDVPVWDIAARFGDATNLLVTNAAQGRDAHATFTWEADST